MAAAGGPQAAAPAPLPSQPAVPRPGLGGILRLGHVRIGHGQPRPGSRDRDSDTRQMTREVRGERGGSDAAR